MRIKRILFSIVLTVFFPPSLLVTENVNFCGENVVLIYLYKFLPSIITIITSFQKINLVSEKYQPEDKRN